MKTNQQIQNGLGGTYVNTTRFSPDEGDSGVSGIICIVNDGGEIQSTNYFDTLRGKAGMYYLSSNAGVARILIPDNETHVVREMKTGKFCVLTSGNYNGQPSVEIMFEDLSSSPFSMCIPQDNCDFRLQNSRKQFNLTAWTRTGKVGEWGAFERVGKKLPCLQPWK